MGKYTDDIKPLWGDLLFRNAVVHITGEPGIGKTTFSYAFGTALSLGNSFIGVAPQSPLRVAIMDYESGENLVAQKLKGIPGSNLLWIYSDEDDPIDSKEGAASLQNQYNEHPWDVLFIDNQGTAFPIRDENDNAEAVRHIKFLKRVARDTNSAVVLYHHPSKADAPGLRKGSGAFAWGRYCDIAANMVAASGGRICLEFTKNRLVSSPRELHFIKSGGCEFQLCVPPSVMLYQPSPLDVPRETVENYILFHLQSHPDESRSNLTEACSKRYKVSDSTVDRALASLMRQGCIEKCPDKFGHYRIRRQGEE